MYKIMIVEDEIVMRDELSILLINNNYEVVSISEFIDVDLQIIQADPALILLDINLPNEDGFHICNKVRAVNKIPIIFLTSRNSDMDQLNSFISGGDDYITKPYHVAILLARITALLKRTYGNQSDDIIEHKGLLLLLEKNVIRYNNKEIELTKNEFKILCFLVKRRGHILSRNEIIEYLWDNEMFVDDNTLSVNITRIRNKLKQIGLNEFIYTKHGQGYEVL